jgi:heat shock protein HslJ
MRRRTMRIALLTLLMALPAVAGCIPGVPGVPQQPTIQPPLVDTFWTLDSLGPQGNLRSVLAGSEVTLSFTGDSEASGNAGCNSYGGTYESGLDGTLSFTELFHTEMYCMTPGLMDQEQAFLDTLATAEQYEIVDGKLRISGGGKLLVFSQA